MVHRVLFWTGFGMELPQASHCISQIEPNRLQPSPFSRRNPETPRLTNLAPLGLAVRVWQLGLEMRPLLNRGSLWAYPVFAGVGASFGYWLQGVNERQAAVLEERKQIILEKRARKAARAAEKGETETL
ncbi:hypothetical protein GGR50DRAFT_640355 [Xylaria sp. CBS 124048]|nr:hypothetical protein GGR50DRAFT_640355 [Xylaria sp. CBS 124048]